MDWWIVFLAIVGGYGLIMLFQYSRLFKGVYKSLLTEDDLKDHIERCHKNDRD